MKTKKLNKKLSLNKETVSHLSTIDMNVLHGGALQSTHDPKICETFYAECQGDSIMMRTCPGFTCPHTEQDECTFTCREWPYCV